MVLQSPRNSHPDYLNMTDSMLLQYFTLHTSTNMTLNPSKYIVWTTVTPDNATKNDFLMHLVLALAGLDLFCKSGERLYGLNERGRPRSSAESITNHPTRQRNRPTHIDATAADALGFGPRHIQAMNEHHWRGLQGFREQYSAL